MEVEIGTEVEGEIEFVVVPSQEMPGTSEQRITDDNDKMIDDWCRLVNSMGEREMDVDPCCPPASEEPAIPDYDLTCYEASILEAEDKLDELALKDIVPTDYCEFLWTRDEQAFTAHRETFTETPGPTFDITDQTRIVDIFYRMIDNDFIDLLCTETNRYADQKINILQQRNNLTPGSRLLTWIPTDRDEMISFLTILILQGLYPMPEEESYFSFNGFGTMPHFKRIMSFKRFYLLKAMLHFVDNETAEPSKLYKIKPVVDYFNNKFSTLYYPSQEIVIDESLLKWFGKLAFSQKISLKAAKQGVKTYELCEASSGYLWKFFIYEGKNKNTLHNIYKDKTETYDTRIKDEKKVVNYQPTPNTDGRPNTTTAKNVYDLVEPLLHKGHTLIMDNFYNSPLLARCLKRQKTDCYGTLRLNRRNVPDSLKTLSKTQLQRGEVLACYCSDLSITVWRDVSLVSLISTYHHFKIDSQLKNNKVSFKPQVVLDYNKFMGGVDRKDQFLSAQPIERKRNRGWHKKLFRRIFNAALFNCFILFKSANPKISHRQFRTDLAESLLKIHRRIDLTMESRPTLRNGQIVMIRPQKVIDQTRPKLEHRHFPVKNGFKHSRCKWCARHNAISRTTWKCLECNVNLCVENCFMEYHI